MYSFTKLYTFILHYSYFLGLDYRFAEGGYGLIFVDNRNMLFVKAKFLFYFLVKGIKLWIYEWSMRRLLKVDHG